MDWVVQVATASRVARAVPAVRVALVASGGRAVPGELRGPRILQTTFTPLVGVAAMAVRAVRAAWVAAEALAVAVSCPVRAVSRGMVALADYPVQEENLVRLATPVPRLGPMEETQGKLACQGDAAHLAHLVVCSLTWWPVPVARLVVTAMVPAVALRVARRWEPAAVARQGALACPARCV